MAAAVLLLSALAMLLSYFVPFVGSWVQAHYIWIFFGTAGPICYLATRPLVDRYNEWDEKRKESFKREKERAECHARLNHLTAQEKGMLSLFIGRDLRATQFSPTDPIAQALVHEGILYIPPEQPNIRGVRRYNIENWAREHLKNNPNLLK